MIVTKNGRRMFPLIKVKVNGLQPEAFYSILLEFKQIDQNRWKYINGEWIAGNFKRFSKIKYFLLREILCFACENLIMISIFHLIIGGKMDPPPKNAIYRHPESPNYGSHWTKEPISFQRVKLTNKGSPDAKNEKIMLNSLHKYEPWIHIEQVSTLISLKP